MLLLSFAYAGGGEQLVQRVKIIYFVSDLSRLGFLSFIFSLIRHKREEIVPELKLGWKAKPEEYQKAVCTQILLRKSTIEIPIKARSSYLEDQSRAVSVSPADIPQSCSTKIKFTFENKSCFPDSLPD